jgi:hypothetical protein
VFPLTRSTGSDVRRPALLALFLAAVAACVAVAVAIARRPAGPRDLATTSADDAVSPARASAPRARAPVPPPAIVTEEAAARAEADAAPAAAADGQLRVKVLAGDRPIAGAQVRAYRREARPLGGVRWLPAAASSTGPDGTALVSAAPGAYLVSAAARGLGGARAEAIRGAGEAITDVVLRLEPTASIAGVTVERRGQAPVTLATVTFTPAVAVGLLRRAEPLADERISATSDVRGEFRAAVPAGRWEVEARAPGHAPAHLHDVLVPRSGELRLELDGAAAVEGVVTRGGKPVAGAAVTVTGAGEPVTVESGPAGGWSVEVDPGVHHVFARAGDETGSAERAVAVAAGAAVRGVEVKLGAPATIAGRVRSAAGPIAGAAVEATPYRDGGVAARAATAADGAYELSGLAPGVYGVAVAAAGRAPAAFPGVALRAGERFRLEVNLGEPSAIEGVVTDPDGNAVSGAVVAAEGGWRRGSGGGAFVARTDGAGHYRLEGVPPGQVRVLARRDESAPASSQMVSVEEERTARADLVVVDGGAAAGTVRDAQGRAIAGALVTAIEPGGPMRRGGRQAVAGDDGSYVLPLPPGTYGMSASRPGSGVRFVARPPVLATAKIALGQRSEVDLVVPDDPGIAIAGRALEPGGAPSPGAFAWVSQGAATQMTIADADGAFTLQVPGDAPIDVNARNGGRTGRATLPAGAAEVTVQLAPAAAVHGRLVGEPPPESSTVTASASGGGFGGGPPGQLQFAGAAFELDDVAPGQVSLRVKTSDGRVGSAQVALAAGESRGADVVLSPAATVMGRAVDAVTGAPVTRGRVLVDDQGGARGLGGDGRFSRTVSAGAHQLEVLAAGYLPATVAVDARAEAPTDVGDLKLSPTSQPAPPPGR